MMGYFLAVLALSALKALILFGCVYLVVRGSFPAAKAKRAKHPATKITPYGDQVLTVSGLIESLRALPQDAVVFVGHHYERTWVGPEDIRTERLHYKHWRIWPAVVEGDPEPVVVLGSCGKFEDEEG